jgi:nitroreductase
MPSMDRDVSPFASREALLQWLEAGVRAPSADNVHHVRFAIRDHADGLRVEMRADDTYVHCREAHQRMLMQLSFGAVTENLRLALGAAVYRTFDPRWFPDPTDPALVLAIDASRLDSLPVPDPLAATIATRHTNRRLYRGPAMSDAEAAAVTGAVADPAHPGISLIWCDDRDQRRAVLDLMRAAEGLRFSDESLHRELFESIDFSVGWNGVVPERLSPATLEVEPPMRALFAAMRHWPLMRTFNGFGAAKMLGFRAGDWPARLAPHIGVLTGRSREPQAVVRAGTQFERLWLAANAAGLALQPMVASAVLAALDDETPKRDAARDRLRAGWRGLIGDATPMVVFRLGHAKSAAAVSARRPVADYLV